MSNDLEQCSSTGSQRTTGIVRGIVLVGRHKCNPNLVSAAPIDVIAVLRLPKTTPQPSIPSFLFTEAAVDVTLAENYFQQPQILTCVGANEAYDQMKITLRPELNPNNPFPQPGQQREFQTQTWRISALYIPAGSSGRGSPAGTTSLVGQFYLAITRNGRTEGSCAGLGGILQNEDTINGGNFLQNQNNPYLQAQFGQPAGSIPDPMMISYGGNVYSGVVRSMSEADLRGRGIGVCVDALCARPTTTCCTIAKDSVAATDQIGSITGTTGFSPNSGSQGLAGVGGLITGLPAGRPTGGNGLSASSSGLF